MTTPTYDRTYRANSETNGGNGNGGNGDNGDNGLPPIPTYIKINTSEKKITVTRNGESGHPITKITLTITGSGLSKETLGGADYLQKQNSTWKFHSETTTGDDIVSYSSLSKVVLSSSNISSDLHLVVDGTSKGTVSEGSTIYEEEKPGPGEKGILDWIKNHLMIVGGAAGGLIFLILILVLVM